MFRAWAAVRACPECALNLCASATYIAAGPLCAAPPLPLSDLLACVLRYGCLPPCGTLPHTGSLGRRCLQTWQPNSRRAPPPIPLASSSSRRAHGSRPPARQARPKRSWAACFRRACHQRATDCEEQVGRGCSGGRVSRRAPCGAAMAETALLVPFFSCKAADGGGGGGRREREELGRYEKSDAGGRLP